MSAQQGPGADAILVVPPFAGLDHPSLAAHLLQACAREAGLRVEVRYASLAFAARIGEAVYQRVSYASNQELLGERLFAAAAYGVPAAQALQGVAARPADTAPGAAEALPLEADALLRLSAEAARFARDFAAALPRCAIVGCTATFQQTAASVALLRALKALRPGVVTLLGGGNCEGEMAEGLAGLGAPIDYICSGECEALFPRLVAALRAGQRPPGPVLRGDPCEDLDALPALDFSEYFAQRDALLPGTRAAADEVAWLPYECSRGCWWGERHHCTFCGLNGGTMRSRQRSPERVLAQLRALLERHPVRRVSMADNIMPLSYLKTLVPRLAGELPPHQIFFEQKANLSLQDLLALKAGGVDAIQPGIEALSTELLRQMNKGVTARQNVALLRAARVAGVELLWNLLYGLPGDRAEPYRETLRLLPLLSHLEPPHGPFPLRLDRFSPYHSAPERYGLRALRPAAAYRALLPAGADAARVAYHFEADYESGSLQDPALCRALQEAAARWRGAWAAEDGPPVLDLLPLGEGLLLLDTRGLPGLPAAQAIDRAEARALLRPRRLDGAPETGRALAAGLGAALDGHYVPLVTAEPALLRELASEGPALQVLAG